MAAPLTVPATVTGGSPEATTQPLHGHTNMPRATAAIGNYTAAVTIAKPGPRLTLVFLANRPPSYVDNIPAVLFTSLVEDQLYKQRENTLIMKFSASRPRHLEI